MITTAHYLVLSAILFSIGLFGVLTRRSILMILLSMELLLNSANLSFVAFSHQWGNLSGQIMVFFSMIVAAAEVTVGLSVVILLFRKTGSTESSTLKELKW